jgi:hypothetical protein
MKVYSTEPSAFNARDEALLMHLATAAGTLLGHIQTPDTPQLISAELRRILRTRDTVNLAKGVLMGRHGLSEDQAHQHLLELAGARGVKTADLAASIIEPESGQGATEEN